MCFIAATQKEGGLVLREKVMNKLGLSCAKLKPAWASYQLAFVWLAFTEAAYYTYLNCLLCLTIRT